MDGGRDDARALQPGLPPIDDELAMLQAFYTAWVALHTTDRDYAHRKKMERRAQDLLDRAHDLRVYYQTRPQGAPQGEHHG